MPPPTICGKGEFMFGGTLFVLSPPMSIVRGHFQLPSPFATTSSRRELVWERLKICLLRTRIEQNIPEVDAAIYVHDSLHQ